MPLTPAALTRDLGGCIGDWTGEVALLGDAGTTVVRNLSGFVEFEQETSGNDEGWGGREGGVINPVEVPVFTSNEQHQPGTRLLWSDTAYQVSITTGINGLWKHTLQEED